MSSPDRRDTLNLSADSGATDRAVYEESRTGRGGHSTSLHYLAALSLTPTRRTDNRTSSARKPTAEAAEAPRSLSSPTEVTLFPRTEQEHANGFPISPPIQTAPAPTSKTQTPPEASVSHAWVPPSEFRLFPAKKKNKDATAPPPAVRTASYGMSQLALFRKKNKPSSGKPLLPTSPSSQPASIAARMHSTGLSRHSPDASDLEATSLQAPPRSASASTNHSDATRSTTNYSNESLLRSESGVHTPNPKKLHKSNSVPLRSSNHEEASAASLSSRILPRPTNSKGNWVRDETASIGLGPSSTHSSPWIARSVSGVHTPHAPGSATAGVPLEAFPPSNSPQPYLAREIEKSNAAAFRNHQSPGHSYHGTSTTSTSASAVFARSSSGVHTPHGKTTIASVAAATSILPRIGSEDNDDDDHCSIYTSFQNDSSFESVSLKTPKKPTSTHQALMDQKARAKQARASLQASARRQPPRRGRRLPPVGSAHSTNSDDEGRASDDRVPPEAQLKDDSNASVGDVNTTSSTDTEHTRNGVGRLKQLSMDMSTLVAPSANFGNISAISSLGSQSFDEDDANHNDEERLLDTATATSTSSSSNDHAFATESKSDDESQQASDTSSIKSSKSWRRFGRRKKRGSNDEKTGQLQEAKNDPPPATRPGAVAVSGGNQQAKLEDRGPTLAPATSADLSLVALTATARDDKVADDRNSISPGKDKSLAKKEPATRPGAFHEKREPKTKSDSGPTLAAATSSQIERNVMGGVQVPQVAKIPDAGPTLAPADSSNYATSKDQALKDKILDSSDGPTYPCNEETTPYRSKPGHSGLEIACNDVDNTDDEEDIEAQAGLPVALPGAYAINGIGVDDENDAAYDSANEDTPSVTETSPEVEEQEDTPEMNDNTPLDAELHHEVVLDGAAVDDDDEVDDPKLKRRLQTIRMVVIFFCFVAVGLVSLSFAGLFDSSTQSSVLSQPTIEGWSLIGETIFGPGDQPQAEFGSSVAISGNRIAVATPGFDTSTSELDVGQIQVFERNLASDDNQWLEITTLIGPGSGGASQSCVNLASNASVLAAGYPRFNASGVVQVFRDNGSGYEEQAYLVPLDSDTTDSWFGFNVEFSTEGAVMAVGAPVANDGPIERAGAIHVYQFLEEKWQRVGDPIFGTDTNEFIGWSVSMSSMDSFRVATGGPSANDESGVVRVFEWDGLSWTQVGQTLVGPTTLGRFGTDISISDDGKVLVVGSRGTAFSPGEVFIFREIDGVWNALPSSIVGRHPSDSFGASVALSGDGTVIAIGSPQNDESGNDNGFLQVWKYFDDLEAWVQQGTSIFGLQSSGGLGMSVDISEDGRRVIGGAPQTTFDGSVAHVGSATVYDRNE